MVEHLAETTAKLHAEAREARATARATRERTELPPERRTPQAWGQ
jgi:hypothetical protein